MEKGKGGGEEKRNTDGQNSIVRVKVKAKKGTK